jgi:hypothetical protein
MTDQCYSNSLISIKDALDNIKAALSPIEEEETVNLHVYGLKPA